jgi:hypothetical protein
MSQWRVCDDCIAGHVDEESEEITQDMNDQWRQWIATYPILSDWTGCGWEEAVQLLTSEAWCFSTPDHAGEVLSRPLSDKLVDFGADAGLMEAVSDEMLNGVKFGAVLGFALARTYPSVSEDINAWLERAITYVGESLRRTAAPEDDPSPA